MDRLNFAALIALAVATCPIQMATTSASPAESATYVATMTFDVTSVRENKNVDPYAGITVSGQFVPHSTTFRAMNWDIQNLITFAYGVNRYQLVGTPKWPWPTMFVIEAKGDNDADAKMAALAPKQRKR